MQAEGFYDMETAGACEACVRKPIEARWTKAKARISIPLSSLPKPQQSVHALVWLPAPADVPAREVNISFHGRLVGSFRASPSAEPRRQILARGLEKVVPRAEPFLDLEWTTSPWGPADHGMADTRELGVLIGFDHWAVLG